MLSYLAVFWYLLGTHVINVAVSTVAIAAGPLVTVFWAWHTLLSHISRTQDEMIAAESKRLASLLPHGPALRARVVDKLLEGNRNPKLKLGKSAVAVTPLL